VGNTSFEACHEKAPVEAKLLLAAPPVLCRSHRRMQLLNAFFQGHDCFEQLHLYVPIRCASEADTSFVLCSPHA
jgi:hypothetical protein